MFRIAFLVEDRHLAKVLTGLTGKVLNLEVNAAVNVAVTTNSDTDAPTLKKYKRGPYKKTGKGRRGAKKRGYAVTDGNQINRVMAKLDETHDTADIIRAKDIQAAMDLELIGKNNYSYIVRVAKARGFLKDHDYGKYQMTGKFTRHNPEHSNGA